MTQGTDEPETSDRALDAEGEVSEAPRDEAPLEASREPSVQDGDELDALRDANAELQASLLRAKADYQNLRRRSQSDYELGLKRTLEPLLHELLLVLDYLELALASPTTSDDAKNLAMGVDMTHKKLLDALGASEVAPIPTDGPFDPALHEAVETRADGDAQPGTLLETVRRGYTWREVVLRPARVVVAADPSDVDAGPGERDAEG